MARLPIPGSDDGAWGAILNDFLSVELNTDGTLKATGSLATKANDSDVIHISGNETVSGTKIFNSSPAVPTPTISTQAANKSYVDNVVASGAPDATGSIKGIVQLAGDLGGTASSPTVPELANKADTSTVNSALASKEPTITAGSTGQYWRGDKTWQTLPAAPVTSVNTQTGAVVLVKGDVGLGNVDNTSDIDKPVSTSMSAEIADRVSVYGDTMSGALGLGNNVIYNVANGINVDHAVNKGQLDAKEPAITSTTSADYYRGDKTFQPLNKAAVGLGNVDNTSDATKNSAAVTLTNKTLTSPVINNPTGFLTGAAKITVGTSAPSTPSTGDLWIDTN